VKGSPGVRTTYLSDVLAAADAIVVVDGHLQRLSLDVVAFHRRVDERLVPLRLQRPGHCLRPALALLAAKSTPRPLISTLPRLRALVVIRELSDVVAYIALLVFLCILLCRCVYMYVTMIGQACKWSVETLLVLWILSTKSSFIHSSGPLRCTLRTSAI